jgi:hypothetical protein
VTAPVSRRDASTDAAGVAQLVLRERQSRDRGWWETWAECFAEDSVVNMSWFTGSGTEFVRQTQLRSVDGVWGRHRLSPPAVQVTGDRAWAELPLAIEFRITVSGVEADLVSYCRSQYRARRIDGDWRITRVTSVYERDSLTPSLPGTSLGLSSGMFAGYRPSYRCLAWYLNQNGSDVSSDLPGDDRPAAVADLYSAERAWLADTTLTATKEP